MSYIRLSGTLESGPSSGPLSSSFVTSLAFACERKAFLNASGVLQRRLESPNAYVSLSAVGDDADVPTANLLYMKSESEMLVRLTLQDGVGGSETVVLPLHGLLVYETQSERKITQVEVQGSGLLEYFASGV